MRRIFWALVLVLGCYAPAQASVVAFEALGSIERSGGTLNTGENAQVGTPVTISFKFDSLEPGTTMDGDLWYAYYPALPVFDFSATIGSYTFVRDTDDPFSTQLVLLGGLTYNDNGISRKAIYANFNFDGFIRAGSQDAPFAARRGSMETLSVSAMFRYNGDDMAIALPTLLSPGQTIATSFDYSVTQATPAGFGRLSGTYKGGLLTASVPETATWAMMVVGIGAVGAGMRRRRSCGLLARRA